MKIGLFLPPKGSPTFPYSSLPYLTGYLRSIGHEVAQCDLGMKALDQMLSAEHLGAVGLAIKADLARRSELEAAETKDRADWRLGALLAADLCADDVIAQIDQAKAILRDPQKFYRPDLYRYAVRLVSRALELISIAAYPTQLNHLRFGVPEPPTLKNIYAVAADPRRNPFLQPMRALLPTALSFTPQLVGVSVPYGDQVIAGFALAMLAKQLWPGVHVTMGGPIVTLAEGGLRRDPAAFAWVDSYVFGEGELAFAELIEAVAGGHRPPADDPHVLMRPPAGTAAGTASAGRARRPEERRKVDFNALPGPDYQGLNLEDFLAPEIMFLVLNARGCYWNKCAFCGVAVSYKAGYRPRKLELLKADLARLREKNGARFIDFADDAIPPPRCGEIADYFAGLPEPTFWQTMIRYEKQFNPELVARLKAGGCRMLNFGNESGCQRVLDLMDKGTQVETAVRVIKDLHAAGIGVILQSFLGFPGETREEADRTTRSLVELKDYITTSAVGLFDLVEFSILHRDPAAFGVVIDRRSDPDWIIPVFEYHALEGATREQARDALRDCSKAMDEAYPAQTFMLDGSFGAHLLLYLAHFNQTKLEPIFPPREKPEGFKRRRPRLRDRVRAAQDGDRGVVLYNPETAAKKRLEPREAEGFKLLDGRGSVQEIERRLLAGGGQTGMEAALVFMGVVYDLYREEFLDLI